MKIQEFLKLYSNKKNMKSKSKQESKGKIVGKLEAKVPETIFGLFAGLKETELSSARSCFCLITLVQKIRKKVLIFLFDHFNVPTKAPAALSGSRS